MPGSTLFMVITFWIVSARLAVNMASKKGEKAERTHLKLCLLHLDPALSEGVLPPDPPEDVEVREAHVDHEHELSQ